MCGYILTRSMGRYRLQEISYYRPLDTILLSSDYVILLIEKDKERVSELELIVKFNRGSSVIIFKMRSNKDSCRVFHSLNLDCDNMSKVLHSHISKLFTTNISVGNMLKTIYSSFLMFICHPTQDAADNFTMD